MICLPKYGSVRGNILGSVGIIITFYWMRTSRLARGRISPPPSSRTGVPVQIYELKQLHYAQALLFSLVEPMIVQ